jgi:glucose/mannose-6-phosphate isomerase
MPTKTFKYTTRFSFLNMISEEEIKNIDKEDMLGSISTLQRQVNGGLKLASEIRVPEEVDDIIVAGMGGSALPGEVLKSLLIDSKIRITVCKDYKLPAWADKKTLVFVISYSGNTEETIASYRDALKKNCQVIAIASGGKLQQLARKQETPFIRVSAKGCNRLSVLFHARSPAKKQAYSRYGK